MTQRVDKDSLPLDKPRRTPGHPTKSHIVKTKVDGKEKIIRFGEQGASTAGKPKAGESERMKAKRASFKARHAKNIAKGKSSPAYWANRVKWAEGGAVEKPRSLVRGLLEQIRDWRTSSMPQEAAPRPTTPPSVEPAMPVSNSDNPYHREAVRLAEKYDLPSNVFLSLVKQESQFNPTARSPKGAYGLTQLMPATARELGVNPRDPMQNLEGGARYLRQQLDTFGSLPLALAAYNAGPGNVRKHGGIPPFRETRDYVRTVLNDAGIKPGFAEGGEVEGLGAYEQLVEAERRARLRAASPLERQTYETLGMEPGLDRAAFLPIAGSRSGGDLQLAAPGILYDLGKALMTPGAAASGVPVSVDDTINLASNVMGGGLGISSPVEGAVAGMAIKQKGGNWLAGDIERGTEPLRIKTAGGMEPSEALEQMLKNYPADTTHPDLMRQITPVFQQLERNTALNRWIDKKLNRYIRNEMATPEDPVRKLAEQGTLHYEPQVDAFVRSYAKDQRAGSSMPFSQLGTSPLARAWEDVADMSVIPTKAEDWQKGGKGRYLQENPWIEKVAPEADVYSMASVEVDRLGFDHLIDELKNSIRPDSDLPAHLRWKPEDLEKVTMEQAVRRVHDINEYRAAKKAEANEALARNPATIPFRTYETIPGTDTPNAKGLEWKEIRAPQDALPVDDGFGNLSAPGYVELEQALKYEGDVMGHCVGGYCDDVFSGATKIYSLRDKNGEPHVTIEVKPEKNPYLNSSGGITETGVNLLFQIDSNLNAEYNDWFRRSGQHSMHFAKGYAPWLKENYPEIYQATIGAPAGQIITQIKGKQNRAPNAEYLPFVQDFVRSGRWERVGDLENTGLYRADPWELGMFVPQDPALRDLPGRRTDDLLRAQQAGLFGDRQYLTREEWEDILRRQVQAEQRPPGMARGGSVRAYNPTLIDAIVSNFNNPGYKAGGAVSTYDPTIINALVNNVLKGIPNG